MIFIQAETGNISNINDPGVFETGRIDAVQALRGIAVMAIVTGHSAIFQRGTFGYDIFFVVSGFTMMYSTQNSSRHFIVRRLIKIFPVYWTATLLRFILSPSPVYNQPFDLTRLLDSLFFLTDFKSNQAQPLWEVGWAINNLVVFYIIFMIACLANHKKRGLTASFYILIWVAAINILALPYDKPTIPLEFIFGILIFEILKYTHIRKNSRVKEQAQRVKVIKNAVYIFLCAATLWFMTSYPAAVILYRWKGNWHLIRPLLLGIPAMIFIYCFYLFFKDKKTPKILVFLGDMSYSCFMFHGFVIAFIKFILLNLNIIDSEHQFHLVNLPNFLFMILVPVICVAVSRVFYWVIEVKFISFLRRILC